MPDLEFINQAQNAQQRMAAAMAKHEAQMAANDEVFRPTT